ncbi:13216_t:CDS:2, partial [Gigaspora rosea]
QRSRDCKVKDEDSNALLVDVQHMKLAGKIVDSVEIELECVENPLEVKKWKSSMTKAIKIDRVEYYDINLEMTFLLGQLCQWIPEVKDIIIEL